MGRASVNERETWRMKLTLGKYCCMNPNLFLGQGHSARWFVRQQALQISRPLSGQEHGNYCTTRSTLCSTCESYLEPCVWINGCISSSFEMLNMQSAHASAVCSALPTATRATALYRVKLHETPASPQSARGPRTLVAASPLCIFGRGRLLHETESRFNNSNSH